MLQVIFTIQVNCSMMLGSVSLPFPPNTLTRDSLAVLDIKGFRRVKNTEQWNKKCYVDGWICDVMGLKASKHGVIASHPFFTCSSSRLFKGALNGEGRCLIEPYVIRSVFFPRFLSVRPLFYMRKEFKMGFDKASFRLWAPANRAASG